MSEAMSDQQELTIGEIGRSVARIELSVTNLANQVQTALAPVSELKVKVERCEADINGIGTKLTDLDEKFDALKSRADRASGGAALLAFASGFLSWFWRHP